MVPFDDLDDEQRSVTFPTSYHTRLSFHLGSALPMTTLTILILAPHLLPLFYRATYVIAARVNPPLVTVHIPPQKALLATSSPV